ncbi:hypothetical protein EWM64_g3797 [Hericium alpestre]|uniref:SET domain-containing protein n=1 Tax=Hericium alpestre TaxID=135208 RepID=A0A4Y9ZZD9_9AGAM|nr:hypothetical protein EWM64_g3797 [Hericium alpestre]
MASSIPAINHLPPVDRRLFVEFGFGTRQAPDFQCVHHAIEHQARSHPDSVAVEHLGSSITYRELEQSAKCLASQLRAMGVKPGVRVCLLVQRSIAMVIGIVAVLKAGGAYVPLDGSIATQSTLEHVIKDAGCLLVLALNEFRHRVRGIPCVGLDDYLVQDDKKTCENPEDLSAPSDSAYIIYTSGTTGTPKGVDVMHHNVTNLVCLAPGSVGMRPGKRVSQLMNIAFDMAAWEILGSLSNGSTLCIRGKSSKEWRAVMKTVDIVIATPSMMVPHDPKDYPNIETVVTAGEALPPSLPAAWKDDGGRSRWTTGCGPTEVTIVNTIQPSVEGRDISIGRPTPNNNVYILDKNLVPVPIGEPGIMFAGGRCVSRGYINRPEITDERYKLDPFANDGSYMFNTGDLGRWRPDGTLEHLGRVDDLVKVKGFRVELDGVAAAMETCTDVKLAVALLVDSELWGFVTPANTDVSAVIAAASKVQPYYAVPTRFLALDEFPRTKNDKTDKRALRQMALDKIASEKSIVIDEKETEKENVPPAPLPVLMKEEVTVPSDVLEPLPVYKGFPSAADVYLPQLRTDDTITRRDHSTSVSSSDVQSSLEKGNAWDGYEDDVLPDKTQGKRLRNLNFLIFTLYRRLFGVVFVVNMSIFIATLVKGGANAQHLGLIVVANLFTAILMRQDYVIDAFFTVFCAVPHSWPISIRRICGRVYSIGGIHSGCAVSGLVWLIYFTGKATREMLTNGPTSVATVVITYWILLFLLIIISHAYPVFRKKSHNRFEATHRLLGWSVTALVWGQVISLANDYRGPAQTLGSALVKAPPFWLVLVMSLSLILPWLRLKKVDVTPEVLSDHAVRLYFDYGVTPHPGSFMRISTRPLMEWHGFATVAEPGKKGYSVVVSRAGDWTSKQIADPPKKLWVRGIPTYGVMRVVPLFRRVVVVATGSGIGPVAPAIFAARVPIRLLWTAPNVRQTFGDKIVDQILEKSPDATIYDTRTHGKPDMVKLTYRLVREFNAEAVCIISNQKLTDKVVYGMMSRGQKRAWKAHHKRICGPYPRYTASQAYEHLPANEKVDAALLSHFLGEYFWSEGSVDEAKKNPRIIVFLSLLQSFPPPDVPSTCGSSVPAGVNPSELFPRFGNNNFVIHSHLKPYAHGIFPFASRLFNHSCVANAAPMYVIKPGQLVRMNVIALRDIALDEEITIPYLDPALPLDDRQRALQANYGFTCSCALCKFEEHMDPGDPSTIEEGLMGSSEISRWLQEYTDCILTRRPTYSDRLRVYEDIPEALRVFFHPSVVPKLSEMFSETSHEGPFEKALNVGHVLLAVYILVYPPNYPQTGEAHCIFQSWLNEADVDSLGTSGLHALEMAKTAWNAFITSSEANGADTTSPDHQLLDNVDWYLDVARHILGTLGPEGDEGGPLEELALLAGLVKDERN